MTRLEVRRKRAGHRRDQKPGVHSSVEARNAVGHKGPGVPGGDEFVFSIPVRVDEEKALTAFQNDSIHYILHVRLKNWVPEVE